MTTEQTALHEKFLKGITLKMLGFVALGIISVVSSFWMGYNGLKDNIKDDNTQTNERITSVVYAFKRSQDSSNNLNAREFQAMWDEIKNIKGKQKSNTNMYSERYLNGKLTFIPVK